MAQQQQQQGRGVNAPAANVHQPLVAGGAAAVVMAAAGGAVAVAGGAPVAPAFGRPAVMPEAYDGSGDWVEYSGGSRGGGGGVRGFHGTP